MNIELEDVFVNDFLVIEDMSVGVEKIPLKLQEKMVTPLKEEQVINPDNGYNGLSRVIIETIPDNYIEPKGILEIKENGEYNVTEYADAIVDIKTEPNIFVGTNEPTVKEGIWLQKDLTVENVIVDENVSLTEEWKQDTSVKDIPYDFISGGIASVGTDIYLIAGDGGYDRNMYKYDTLTNAYTSLADLPSYANAKPVVGAIGDYIYIIDGYDKVGSSNNAYKYSILDNTHTQISNSPNCVYGSGVVANSLLYIIRATTIYTYNPTSDTYTEIATLPHNSQQGSSVVVGDDIYLFGSETYGHQKKAYKYNISTNEFTQLTDIPYNFYGGSAVAIGTTIYLFGGTNASNNCYKYDIETDTYTQLADIPLAFSYGGAVAINNKIYLFGGDSNSKKVQILDILTETYQANSVIIEDGTIYKTQLYVNDNIDGRLLNYFGNVYYSGENGIIDDTVPKYYGNGESWIRF